MSTVTPAKLSPNDRSHNLSINTFRPFHPQPRGAFRHSFWSNVFQLAGCVRWRRRFHSLCHSLHQSSPFDRRLDKITPPKRFRFTTDWSFAFSCSPHRLTTTQLLSATEYDETLNGTCTHLIFILRSRTINGFQPLTKVSRPSWSGCFEIFCQKIHELD